MIKQFNKFLNEGKGYPISETEMGAWYESEYNYDSKGNKYAYFFPLNSAYYDNILSKDGKEYTISSFADFKKVYSISLGNNMFRTEFPPKRKYPKIKKLHESGHEDIDPYNEEIWEIFKIYKRSSYE